MNTTLIASKPPPEGEGHELLLLKNPMSELVFAGSTHWRSLAKVIVIVTAVVLNGAVSVEHNRVGELVLVAPA